MLSFSSGVKDEICRIAASKECCREAELIAIALVTGFTPVDNGVKFVTESASFARRMYATLKYFEAIKPEVEVKKNERLRKSIHYCLKCEKLPFSLVEIERILERAKNNDCCKKAFLKGTFLAVGSISAPEKTYHLEIAVDNEKAAIITVELMKDFNLNPKVVERKGNFVIYIKEGEDLVDFLNIVGAHKALLEIENVRILKDMRNNVNRIVNCETANLEKTLDASFRQLDGIILIRDKMGFGKLPDGLRKIAELRLDNKDANLKELGEMLEYPIGKSGVNHRLKKLEKIAEKIRSKEGEFKDGGRDS